VGKASLQRATGLDKAGRIARAKKRAEDQRKVDAEVARQMIRGFLDQAVNSRAVEVRNNPAMLMETPSADTAVPSTPQKLEMKEEEP
jgi:hypothetical protein